MTNNKAPRDTQIQGSIHNLHSGLKDSCDCGNVNINADDVSTVTNAYSQLLVENERLKENLSGYEQTKSELFKPVNDLKARIAELSKRKSELESDLTTTVSKNLGLTLGIKALEEALKFWKDKTRELAEDNGQLSDWMIAADTGDEFEAAVDLYMKNLEALSSKGTKA